VLAFSFVACGRDKQEEDPPTPKPPVQKMEIADYVKSLSEDEYTVENLTDSYGLSDPANVGVRKEGRSKGMYEIPADSQFSEDAIFDVEDYISKGKSDTEALTAAINDAKDFQKNGGKVKIKLPDRDLNIDRNSSGLADTTYTLSVAGFDGLYIQGGENTVLTINTGSSWLGGVSLLSFRDGHRNGKSVFGGRFPCTWKRGKQPRIPTPYSVLTNPPEPSRGPKKRWSGPTRSWRVQKAPMQPSLL